MTKTSTRKKRSKLAIVLMAPILVILFAAGWALYWIGQSEHKQPQQPIPKTTTTQEKIQLMVIPPKEEQTITN